MSMSISLFAQEGSWGYRSENGKLSFNYPAWWVIYEDNYEQMIYLGNSATYIDNEEISYPGGMVLMMIHGAKAELEEMNQEFVDQRDLQNQLVSEIMYTDNEELKRYMKLNTKTYQMKPGNVMLTVCGDENDCVIATIEKGNYYVGIMAMFYTGEIPSYIETLLVIINSMQIR